MLLRRLATLLVATGVLLAAMGMTAAATGDRPAVGRQAEPSGSLKGAGASFPCGYLEQAIDDAERLDLTVTYSCEGSSDGRAAFISGSVDFAGTDVPLDPGEIAQLAANGVKYVQFAYVGGGIALAYNPGSGLPYNLELSADTIGKIFSGQIVNWNDAQLARENPGVSLPDLRLRVAAREDSSGTSTWFTAFMAGRSTSWTGGTRAVFDSPPLPDFPGLLTVDGSEGVADAVRDNPGMIGYVELSFARERRLNVAAVEGADGFMLPDSRAVAEAVAELRPSADGTASPDFATAPGYPLSVVTYLLVRQDNGTRQSATNLRAFSDLLLTNNAKAASLAYAPLATSLVDYARQQIDRIGPGGSAPASTTTVAATVRPSSATPSPSPTVAATTVQPSPPTTHPATTPVTGSTSPWLIGVGLALIAAGLGFVRLSRKDVLGA